MNTQNIEQKLIAFLGHQIQKPDWTKTSKNDMGRVFAHTGFMAQKNELARKFNEFVFAIKSDPEMDRIKALPENERGVEGRKMLVSIGQVAQKNRAAIYVKLRNFKKAADISDNTKDQLIFFNNLYWFQANIMKAHSLVAFRIMKLAPDSVILKYLQRFPRAKAPLQRAILPINENWRNGWQILAESAKAKSSFERELIALKPEIMQRANQMISEWEQEEDDLGGLCDEIADMIADVVAIIPDVELELGGHDGDDHAWIIARKNGQQFGIDIPADAYETGGGYSWKKIQGATVSISDVQIFDLGSAILEGRFSDLDFNDEGSAPAEVPKKPVPNREELDAKLKDFQDKKMGRGNQLHLIDKKLGLNPEPSAAAHQEEPDAPDDLRIVGSPNREQNKSRGYVFFRRIASKVPSIRNDRTMKILRGIDNRETIAKLVCFIQSRPDEFGIDACLSVLKMFPDIGSEVNFHGNEEWEPIYFLLDGNQEEDYISEMPIWPPSAFLSIYLPYVLLTKPLEEIKEMIVYLQSIFPGNKLSRRSVLACLIQSGEKTINVLEFCKSLNIPLGDGYFNFDAGSDSTINFRALDNEADRFFFEEDLPEMGEEKINYVFSLLKEYGVWTENIKTNYPEIYRNFMTGYEVLNIIFKTVSEGRHAYKPSEIEIEKARPVLKQYMKDPAGQYKNSYYSNRIIMDMYANPLYDWLVNGMMSAEVYTFSASPARNDDEWFTAACLKRLESSGPDSLNNCLKVYRFIYGGNIELSPLFWHFAQEKMPLDVFFQEDEKRTNININMGVPAKSGGELEHIAKYEKYLSPDAKISLALCLPRLAEDFIKGLKDVNKDMIEHLCIFIRYISTHNNLNDLSLIEFLINLFDRHNIEHLVPILRERLPLYLMSRIMFRERFGTEKEKIALLDNYASDIGFLSIYDLSGSENKEKKMTALTTIANFLVTTRKTALFLLLAEIYKNESEEINLRLIDASLQMRKGKQTDFYLFGRLMKMGLAVDKSEVRGFISLLPEESREEALAILRGGSKHQQEGVKS